MPESRRDGVGSRPAELAKARTQVRSGALLALALLASCQSPAPLGPVNVSEPGWRVRQGQAVWTRDSRGAGIAGELWLALNVDGRVMAQFTKPPLPFLTARLDSARWQVEFHADNRRFSGRGPPPVQFIWLHLAGGLAGQAPPKPLQFQSEPAGAWRLVNTDTGERLSGYLNP